MPGLSKRYRVIAPDGLGAGITGNPLTDEDYNMQGMVKHLLEFIELMNLGRITCSCTKLEPPDASLRLSIVLH